MDNKTSGNLLKKKIGFFLKNSFLLEIFFLGSKLKAHEFGYSVLSFVGLVDWG